MTEQISYRRSVDQIGFAQVCHLVTLDGTLSDGAVRLYMLLLKYAQDKGACWPGITRLARELHKSKRTVKRYLMELVERGLITREQRGNGKTAKTWIEDLEAVYGDGPTVSLLPSGDTGGTAMSSLPAGDTGGPSMSPQPVDNSRSDKNGPASSDKNGPALAVTNLSPKEEQEEEQTNDVDGWTTEQRQSLMIFRENDADVTRTVLRIARRRSPDDVRGMIEAAKRKRGLSNPIGWAIAQLRDGAPVPTVGDDDGRAHQRITATCPICYRVRPIERICEKCGRCSNCCACKEQRPGRRGPERRGGRVKEVTNSKNPTQDILPQKLEGGE